jgi:hypothetical protein
MVHLRKLRKYKPKEENVKKLKAFLVKLKKENDVK